MIITFKKKRIFVVFSQVVSSRGGPKNGNGIKQQKPSTQQQQHQQQHTNKGVSPQSSNASKQNDKEK